MGRGRSYPAIGLREAVQRARALYDQEGTAMTVPEVAVSAWGYKSLNGTSLRVLSALRQYGLLTGSGEQIRLSDRALDIIMEPDESQDRRQAILAAAKEPVIFADIQESFEWNLPSDGSIVSHLVRKHNFVRGAANKIVAALRETEELAREVDGSYSDQEDLEDTGNQASEITSDPTQRSQLIPPSGMFTMPIPLPGGGEATLTTPRQMTPQAFQLIVDALKSGLKLYRGALVEGNGQPDEPDEKEMAKGWPENDNKGA